MFTLTPLCVSPSPGENPTAREEMPSPQFRNRTLNLIKVSASIGQRSHATPYRNTHTHQPSHTDAHFHHTHLCTPCCTLRDSISDADRKHSSLGVKEVAVHTRILPFLLLEGQRPQVQVCGDKRSPTFCCFFCSGTGLSPTAI